MESNADIQEVVLNKLKADVTLVGWITAEGAGDEIREAQWQGDVFVLPAVRISIGTQLPLDGSHCQANTRLEFTVSCIGEEASSLQVDTLASLVNDALLGQTLAGSTFRTAPIVSGGATGAMRIGDQRVWRAFNLYSVVVYGSKS